MFRAAYLCAIGERKAGLYALEVGAIWQEYRLSPTALLGTSPPGDGYVTVWREAGAMLEVWPSCSVPVPMNGMRKQGQNKTSAFGQSCPYLTMRASVLELSLFFEKGTGLSRSLVPWQLTRLLRGWWAGCRGGGGEAGLGDILGSLQGDG